METIGFSPILVESNPLQLIQACNGIVEVWSQYTTNLADVFLRAHVVGAISFHHCRREANKVAHNLAGHTFDTNSTLIWVSNPPRFFCSDILNYVTIIKLK